MRGVRIFLPAEMIEGLDQLVEDGKFGNRSEAIRAGCREILKKWAKRARS